MEILRDPMWHLIGFVISSVTLAVAVEILRRRKNPAQAEASEAFERREALTPADDTPGGTGGAIAYIKKPKAPPQLWAYDFVCDKPMAEIRAVLNAEGPWHWIERDKEAFGDYLSSAPGNGLRVRIYDLDGRDSNGPSYTADVRLELDELAINDTRDDIRDDSPPAPRTSTDEIFRTLLKRIGARHITRGCHYD